MVHRYWYQLVYRTNGIIIPYMWTGLQNQGMWALKIWLLFQTCMTQKDCGIQYNHTQPLWHTTAYSTTTHNHYDMQYNHTQHTVQPHTTTMIYSTTSHNHYDIEYDLLYIYGFINTCYIYNSYSVMVTRRNNPWSICVHIMKEYSVRFKQQTLMKPHKSQV